jgi:sulfoxide reductase heme-binding subunit YedZ
MKSRTKWLFYVILVLPLLWLGWRIYQNDMGANPAETLNKKLGQDTLYLFLANLYWGSFDAMISPRPLRPWLALRRPLGVATFLYALMHLCSYFLREGNFSVALGQMTEKVYLLFGLSAFFVLSALAATSNNWSLRKLRFPRWKKLHRLVFLAFILICTHVFLIEKRSPLSNKFTLFPMIAVLLCRLFYSGTAQSAFRKLFRLTK